ncbi:MAG: nuclear transport factor 2 family protein [Candidatus Eisenbacteria bacterium]
MTQWLTTSLILLGAFGAQPAAPDAAELTRLLHEFLAGAGGTNAAVHERFWAEDLIYTGSGGRRVGKADILRDVRSAPSPSPHDPVTVYSAEDVRIQQYGATALVAFRLVGTTRTGGTTQVACFLNTGTFARRGSRWQAVGWQATRLPVPPEEARVQVAAAGARFHLALVAADTTALAELAEENFIWTNESGERLNRRTLLDAQLSRRMRYSRIEHDSVVVQLHGDAAVVRGRLARRTAMLEGVGRKDPIPLIVHFTMLFINAGGDWKTVAMHTSQP